MVLWRIVFHLLLALVLMAGGLASAPVAADGDLPAAAVEAPCHGMGDDAGDPPAEAGCCQDGGCPCDCLQHIPAASLVASPLPRLVLRARSERARAPVVCALSGAPEIRPPIA